RELEGARAETARLAQASASRLVEEAARAAAAESVVAQALEAEEEIARSVEPGGRARVRSLGAEGVVLAFDGDWARMEISGKRLRVRRSDLEPARAPKTADGRRRTPEGSRRQDAGGGRQGRRAAAEDLGSLVPEIHVIGQRVEEAIEVVDKALDRALLAG